MTDNRSTGLKRLKNQGANQTEMLWLHDLRHHSSRSSFGINQAVYEEASSLLMVWVPYF